MKSVNFSGIGVTVDVLAGQVNPSQLGEPNWSSLAKFDRQPGTTLLTDS